MRSVCLSVPHGEPVLKLFSISLCALVVEFEFSIGASLRQPRGATASPTGGGGCPCTGRSTDFCLFSTGASSSAEIVVALKRAFWDFEDVLASVGIAKSSSRSVCTDLVCAQNLSGTKITPWRYFLNEGECRCFGNKFFCAKATPWRRKLLWWAKRQRLHEKKFCELCCS